EAYREALRRQLAPEDRAVVVRQLAEVLIDNQANYPAALEILDAYPDLVGQEPALQAVRAECLVAVGRRDEAGPLLDAALRANPPPFRALRLRARLFAERDRYREALPLLEQALRQEPQDHSSRQLLIQACQTLGDTERAAKEQRLAAEAIDAREQLTVLFEKVSERPWDDELRCRIAELCLKLKRPQEARTALRAALACNPDNEQARRLLPAPAAAPPSPA